MTDRKDRNRGRNQDFEDDEFEPQGNFGYEGQGYMSRNRNAEGGEGYEDLSRNNFGSSWSGGRDRNEFGGGYQRESFGGGYGREQNRGGADYSGSSGQSSFRDDSGRGLNQSSGRGKQGGSQLGSSQGRYGQSGTQRGAEGNTWNASDRYRTGALAGYDREDYAGVDQQGGSRNGRNRFEGRGDFGEDRGDIGSYANIGGYAGGNDYDTGFGARYGSGATSGSYGDSARRESYRGKGPKGYQRSDDRVREDVCDRLEQDHDVDASEIEVKVSGGTVTLSGSVSDRSMKRRAEDLVESIQGVRDVENQIRVTRDRNASGSTAQASAGRNTSSSGSTSTGETSSNRSNNSKRT
jgi:osmotically-inducible protein OsmY